MRFAARRRPEPEINLTSLIDIMFTVMLFLLLSTTFAEFTRIQVVLPEADTGAPVTVDPNRIRILVEESGAISLGDARVTLDELARALASTAISPDADVLLRADRRVAHGDVVAVMDVVRKAGLLQLAIETTTETRLGSPP